ncbi:MAG TPA: hypothetical protein VJQ47_12995 [Steroidobacteraceae bacterium]|nr:hypothetical protein [Steroidobacteraceae bacterium]
MDSKALPQMTQKPEIDRDVRQFLADGEPRRRLSVIVEARFDDKPTGAALQERLKPLASIRGPKLVRKHIHINTNPHLNEIGSLLKHFDTPRPPVRLEMADAYVAALSAHQIQKISQSPAVGAIRLNREHHVPK